MIFVFFVGFLRLTVQYAVATLYSKTRTLTCGRYFFIRLELINSVHLPRCFPPVLFTKVSFFCTAYEHHRRAYEPRALALARRRERCRGHGSPQGEQRI